MVVSLGQSMFWCCWLFAGVAIFCATTDCGSAAPTMPSSDYPESTPSAFFDADEIVTETTNASTLRDVTCDAWHEQRCEDGVQCVLKMWMCDGRRDCLDGSDEDPSICHHPRVDGSKGTKGRFLPPTFKCPSTWFFCRDASRCIESASKCNGVDDCDDGSDEGGFCHYLNIVRIVGGTSDDSNSTIS